MGNHRLTRSPTSDDDDKVSLPRRRSAFSDNLNIRKRKLVQFSDDDEDDKDIHEPKLTDRKNNKKSDEPEPDVSSENDEEGDLDAQPIGDVVRVSGKGRGRRKHYDSFEYNGIQYSLEEPALFRPEEKNQKPYVAIIKDISQTCSGELMVTGQWFYRPEEAEKKGGGNWPLLDTRELFYSFHRDEVPAESIFHKCVAHFIPLNKQIPSRKKHPGFIVQKVYDTEQRKLFKLTDKDYEESKQHEIDLLVQKTLERLGDVPDIVTEDADVDREDPLKTKRLLRRKNLSLLDVSRDDDGLGKSHTPKPETPGIASSISSEYYAILSKYKMLTEETQRDKWLEKLLQSIQFICTPMSDKPNDGEERVSDVRSPDNKDGGSNNGTHDKASSDISFEWPDAAVPAVTALEKAAHAALSTDFQKYNQKMRQLAFNLKGNATLARRLLNKELEPSQILNMLPNELKAGLTAEEIASREPEKSGRLQMTDARCKRCNEKQVGLIDIIQTGHEDRYQLECVACGNTWYASRDDAATLTIEEAPSSAKTVGIAPLATAKFEDVEKSLASPSGTEMDILKKSSEAYVPVLENQRSFNRTPTEENPPADTNAVK